MHYLASILAVALIGATNAMKSGSCTAHTDCLGNQACSNRLCINPCSNTCGIGAVCETRNHVPVCSCPSGFTGHPFTECRKQKDEELCEPSPCGANTKCDVVNGIPTCSCLLGYYGKPIAGCRHECEKTTECGDQEYCDEFRCKSACNQCGKGAQCLRIVNHVASCECPKGYLGSPFTECKAECEKSSECPKDRPACFYGACKNLCDGVCGMNAECNLRDSTPVCSCPKGMRGDPFTKCYPVTAENLCKPNPCGENSKCKPGKNSQGEDRAICSCETGYTGDAIKGCVRGECVDENGCSLERACIGYKCVDPCSFQCGKGAVCEAKRHLAFCSCPEGTKGDALQSCYKA